MLLFTSLSFKNPNTEPARSEEVAITSVLSKLGGECWEFDFRYGTCLSNSIAASPILTA